MGYRNDSFTCPHHPTDALGDYLTRCECRKPAPGMILQAAKGTVSIGRFLLVGDWRSDIEAGKAAGVGRLFHVSTATEIEPGRLRCGQLAPGSGGQDLSICATCRAEV